MKILIAPDKFKGSLSAKEVCMAIAKGLRQTQSNLDIRFHPMADGGDGSIAILSEHLKLQVVEVNTTNPLGRPITANYYVSEDTAFIELASASGLVLLPPSERNPLLASTLGTGKMIADAIGKGFRKIYLFLGGSATNDAGIGIAHGLGFRFLDTSKKEVKPIGQNLIHIDSVQNKTTLDLSKIQLTLFCDVENPLFGPSGAAFVYAAQKGATPDQIQELDKGLRHYSQVLERHFDKKISQLEGAGAAGGIAASLVPLLGAELVKGFTTIAKLTLLEKQIRWADRVISGEGRLDSQSLQGKVIKGVSDLCQHHQKPLDLVVGSNELSPTDLQKNTSIRQVLSILDIAHDVEDAMLNGKGYLEELARQL